jgi:hypothetical protein
MNTKSSKKIISTVLTAILVLSMFTAIAPVSANNGVTPEQKEEAIEKGLAWLAAQQDDTGAWNLGYYPVGSTAFAVLKFEHHAKEILKIDPFSDEYIYKDNIVAGLKYLFENAAFQDIGVQPAGDPDVNLVNGKGIYFSSGRTLYETGIVMMALEASCHPEFKVDAPGSLVSGWTYEDVMKDTVDFVAWAQNDAGNGRGGWRYNPNSGNSDNSVSQWPALGLMSAAGWGIGAPDWVKTELEDYWLTYSQGGDGCFGYTGPGSYVSGPVGVTAAGLIELTYCGVTTDDTRWEAGRECICKNWANSNIGNLYAMYGVMKASMTAQPEPIWWYNCTCGTHEWQPEYDVSLNDSKICEDDKCYWNPGSWGNKVLGTEWALLILQKVVPPPPQNPLWHEINKELVSLKDNVSAADMPNIIKRRLVDKLVYAEELKHNAKEECEAGNFDGATKKLGVAKSQVESFASMVRITRRISPADKASFLADSTEIIGKIDRLIEYIETEHKC